MYSFADGFLGYHQVIIAKEDFHKMTFVIEWGCYQYMVMPFGLKNAPAIFSRIVVSALKYFLHKFIEVYFDDWTMFGLVRDHIESLCMMLGCCHHMKSCLIQRNVFFAHHLVYCEDMSRVTMKFWSTQ